MELFRRLRRCLHTFLSLPCPPPPPPCLPPPLHSGLLLLLFLLLLFVVIVVIIVIVGGGGGGGVDGDVEISLRPNVHTECWALHAVVCWSCRLRWTGLSRDRSLFRRSGGSDGFGRQSTSAFLRLFCSISTLSSSHRRRCCCCWCFVAVVDDFVLLNYAHVCWLTRYLERSSSSAASSNGMFFFFCSIFLFFFSRFVPKSVLSTVLPCGACWKFVYLRMKCVYFLLVDIQVVFLFFWKLSNK